MLRNVLQYILFVITLIKVQHVFKIFRYFFLKKKTVFKKEVSYITNKAIQ